MADNGYTYENVPLAHGEIPKVDVVMTKTDPHAVVEDEMLEVARTYNLVQFTPPGVELTLRDLFWHLGCAYLFVANEEHGDVIPPSEVTLTVQCDDLPEAAFAELGHQHVSVRERHPGIFELDGFAFFPVQVVVKRLLDPVLHPELRAQLEGATEADLRAFVALVSNLTEPQNQKSAYDALLWSHHVNEDLYVRMRAQDPDFDARFQKVMSWGDVGYTGASV